MVLAVADTGAGLDGGSAPGQGIGLANVRERLRLLYGDAASLDLEGNEPAGFVARLRLPFSERPQPAAASAPPALTSTS
jgi:LytS/YehU family sensor histidine kinase